MTAGRELAALPAPTPAQGEAPGASTRGGAPLAARTNGRTRARRRARAVAAAAADGGGVLPWHAERPAQLQQPQPQPLQQLAAQPAPLQLTGAEAVNVNVHSGSVTVTVGTTTLLVNAAGDKRSKRNEALTVRSLREAGVAPEALAGWLAAALGQGPARARTPAEVAETFDISRVPTAPVPVPADLAARLRAL